MVDRDPLRTIAGMALQGDKGAPGLTLEDIVTFAWDQLAQRHTSNNMAALLRRLNCLDLLLNKEFPKC
jgi:hypothetical protein